MHYAAFQLLSRRGCKSLLHLIYDSSETVSNQPLRSINVLIKQLAIQSPILWWKNSEIDGNSTAAAQK